MKKSTALIIVFLVCMLNAFAQKRMSVNDINTDKLTEETQISFSDVGDDHLAVVWWIPNEFWESLLAKDSEVDNQEVEDILKVMQGVSLLAVIQADIGPYGAFHFYSKQHVEENLSVSVTMNGGDEINVPVIHQISPDLVIMLMIFKPILAGAMGNMGENMHFFVLKDVEEAYSRLINPYKEGEIIFNLLKRNKEKITDAIEIPLNSLFIPRICPNGRKAHVTWNYCPWTGEKLEE